MIANDEVHYNFLLKGYIFIPNYAIMNSSYVIFEEFEGVLKVVLVEGKVMTVLGKGAP